MYVGPDGPLTASIALIGEAPGEVEARTGKPFTGPVGDQLNELLTYAGHSRSEVYLTNVVKTSTATPTDADIQQAIPGLYRELAALPACNVFVAAGAVALKALSAWRYQAITKLRGSILETAFGGKMVPVIHPSWYMRGEWRYKPVTIQDLKRAFEQSKFPEIRRPERTFVTNPTLDEAVAGLREARGAEFLSVDIETFGKHIACHGLSWRPGQALCIPVMKAGGVPYWSTPAEEAVIWRELALTLAAPSKKIFQNGCFDIRKYAELGIEVENLWMDTLLAHHLLRPELPHGLDFITSIYTEEPYYKDEGKEWNHSMPDGQLWGYNCKDAVVTLEAALELEKDLREEGLWNYFQDWVIPLVGSTLGMTMRGILVDQKALREAQQYVIDRVGADGKVGYLQKELNDLVGFDFNVKAPTSILKFLRQIGVPEREIKLTDKSRQAKHDEKTMRLYQSRHPHRGFELLFELVELRTLLSGFLQLKTDHTGHYHPLYKPHGTKYGRYSSEGAETGGPQIQNIPEPTRNIFIPHPGKGFANVDEASAESYIVAFDAQEETLMAFLLAGKDPHRFYSSIIFGRTDEWIDKLTPEEFKAWKKRERYPAKRIGHGSNYRMSARRIVTELRAEGIFIAEGDAQRYQRVYFSTFPGIVKWHEYVEQTVRRTRVLTTPFGRKIPFLGLVDDETVRSAISCVPQSTVAEIAKRAQLKLDKWLPEIGGSVQTQTHDSLLMEYDLDKRDRLREMVQDAFDIPITLHGRTFVVPIELSFGPNWRDLSDAA